MATRIQFHYDQKREVTASTEKLMAYLCEFEKSVPENFPGLERFEETQPSTYRWQFEKLEHAGQKLQLVFLTKIEKVSPERISMQSVAEVGQSKLAGEWIVQESNDHSTVRFRIDMELELPIPFFLKSIANVFAQRELHRIFDRYLNNVSEALKT